MSEFSTTELARIATVAESIAAAAKSIIDQRGRTAHAAGDKMSVEALEGDVSAFATTSNARINITDPEKLHAFLQELYPHNFETKTITFTQPINPAWVAKQLEAWLPQVLKGEMDAPPGTRLVEGGEYVSTTVKPKNGAKKLLQEAARTQLEQGQLPPVFRAPLELDSGVK